MEWSNTITMTFLDLYEKEPIIWNPRHECHKDRSQVYDAWKRIRTTLGIEGSLKELKKKKETLMATYRKLSIRVKNSKRKGSKRVYKPTWFAYDKMASFLHSVYKPRITIAPKIQQNRHESDEEYLTYTEYETNEADQAEALGISSYLPNIESNDTIAMETTAVGQSAQRRNAVNAGNVEKRLNETYHLLKQIAAKPHEKRDETSMFCELLCSKLRALDEDTRDIAMHEINNLMFGLKKKQPNMPLHDNYQQPSYFHVGPVIKQSQSPDYGTGESSRSWTSPVDNACITLNTPQDGSNDDQNEPLSKSD